MNIYLPFTTVAATILTQLDGALTDGTGFAVATLAELALVLAVISVGGQPRRPAHHHPDGPGRRAGRGCLMSTTLSSGPATRRRRVSSSLWRVLTYLALILIMAPAAWLLIGVLARAWSHWQWSVLWTPLTSDRRRAARPDPRHPDPHARRLHHRRDDRRARRHPPGRAGRGPAGSAGSVSGPLRTASDILSGFPSIVLGYVGYVALVVGLHWGFSLLSALIILSIMVIPYIAKTTENSLRQVPTGYREGAEALGMSMGYGAAQGGAQERAARDRHRAAAGAGHRLRRDRAADLHGRVREHAAALADPRPVPLPDLRRLPYYNAPETQYHYLSYDAALILVVIVLLLLVSSRIIVARTQRHSEGARGTRIGRRPSRGRGPRGPRQACSWTRCRGDRRGAPGGASMVARRRVEPEENVERRT